MELKFKLHEEINDGLQYLYRYEDGFEQIRLRRFRIVRETNCGWWISKYTWFDKNNLKFVYKTGKNNFAKKTKKEAIENYYYRKCHHVAILNNKLMRTKNLLRKAELLMKDQEEKPNGN